MSGRGLAIRQESDLRVDRLGEHSALIEICRPPHNYFDLALLTDLADTLLMLDEMPKMRSILLCSEGKNFCAGANFSSTGTARSAEDFDAAYAQVSRILSARKPLVVAMQGAAIGGGLGLACIADFRVGSGQCRLSANFVQLGLHHGFGLSASLPRITGNQAALGMLYTGRRVKGDEAYEMGLLDYIVDSDQIRPRAQALVHQLAQGAPLALMSIRATMRESMLSEMKQVLEREAREQILLRGTHDFSEGISAATVRRTPQFTGM